MTATYNSIKAETWPHMPHVRRIVHQANRDHFHRARDIRVAGDVEAWFSGKTEGRKVLDALEGYRKMAVTSQLGYHWDKVDWNAPNHRELLNAWFAVWESIPTGSEVLEMEFARREDREPRLEYRPTKEQADAFRSVVGAGLGSKAS